MVATIAKRLAGVQREANHVDRSHSVDCVGCGIGADVKRRGMVEVNNV